MVELARIPNPLENEQHGDAQQQRDKKQAAAQRQAAEYGKETFEEGPKDAAERVHAKTR